MVPVHVRAFRGFVKLGQTKIDNFFLNSFYVCEYLCACLYVYHGHTVPAEGVSSPGTEVMDGCEPPCGCWELNLVPLQDRWVLLTSCHLSSLQGRQS